MTIHDLDAANQVTVCRNLSCYWVLHCFLTPAVVLSGVSAKFSWLKTLSHPLLLSRQVKTVIITSKIARFWMFFGQFKSLLWSKSHFVIWKRPLDAEMPRLGSFDEKKVVVYQCKSYQVPCQSRKKIILDHFGYIWTNLGCCCSRPLCDMEPPSWGLKSSIELEFMKIEWLVTTVIVWTPAVHMILLQNSR